MRAVITSYSIHYTKLYDLKQNTDLRVENHSPVSSMHETLTIVPLTQMPFIKAGDDLASLILEAMNSSGIQPAAGDILVVAQKIVSKSEGRMVRLADIEPSAEATGLARETGKDPRLLELILQRNNFV